jgi:hypothetical protein
MPIPTCEVTKAPFENSGEKAPHVLPCRHVYSLIGIKQVRWRFLTLPSCCAQLALILNPTRTPTAAGTRRRERGYMSKMFMCYLSWCRESPSSPQEALHSCEAARTLQDGPCLSGRATEAGIHCAARWWTSGLFWCVAIALISLLYSVPFPLQGTGSPGAIQKKAK